MKSEPKVLFEDEGLRITVREMVTPVGDFPLKDIQSFSDRVTRPLWGPVILALIGTITLAVALQTRTWYDFIAAAGMLGYGLFWRMQGVRHVLTIKVPKGDVNAWVARRAAPVKQAMAVLEQQLGKLDNRQAEE